MRYIFKNKIILLFIALIDFIGNILFMPFRVLKRHNPGNVSKILVIRLDHIGDVIFSTPIPKNLKSHYKGAKITFLVGSWSKDIVMNNPHIDEVISYNAPWFDRSRKKLFEVIKFFRLAAELRKQQYDIGFDPRGDFRHILLMFISGIRFRVGYGMTGGGFMLHRQGIYRDGIHSMEHNLDLLKDMHIKIESKDIEFYSSPKDKKAIGDFLKANHVSKNTPMAIAHPFSGNISKNWSCERFADLLRRIDKEFSLKLIVIGSENDREEINNIIKTSKVDVLNGAGLLSLGALLELMKMSKIFIGVDSGPSHIAALSDLASVILYSGTNSPDEWGPLSKKSIVIQMDIPCKGCHRIDCKDNICMDLITVEDVIESINKVIAI